MAEAFAANVGREVMLARTNLGISVRNAARVAGVAPATQKRVERGDSTVGIATACRVAAAVGLKVWAKAYPIGRVTLRDSGQLRIAEFVRRVAHAGYRISLELALADGRSADLVLFGALEIIHVEIERRLADWQAQFRAAVAKRDDLAAQHQRPVRLVMVIEDTVRNREAISEHGALVRSALPAGSREVMRSLQRGDPLGRDGILWVRSRNIGDSGRLNDHS
jgi:transcriptional regulator with XRE-family HTH domain